MNITAYMIAHGIERIVYVPASDLLPNPEFHAWLFDNTMECGIGVTAEEAAENAVRFVGKRAA